MFRPQWFIADRSGAEVLLWFSVACFWCRRFGGILPFVCSCFFSSGSVAGWPPFGGRLLTRLTICSLCILTICYISFSRFGFEVWIWVLIASVPDLCILFTF